MNPSTNVITISLPFDTLVLLQKLAGEEGSTISETVNRVLSDVAFLFEAQERILRERDCKPVRLYFEEEG